MTPDYSGFGQGAELLNRLAEQARTLSEMVEEIEALEAEVTDDRHAVTVRCTAGGVVEAVTIHAAARTLSNQALGELITATTNFAFARAQAAAAARAGDYHAAQREINEQLRRHDPAAAAALTEFTAKISGPPASVTSDEQDDEPRRRGPTVFDD
ncbi:YbaB/EbfC DNA-binding family protein [Nocardia tenerifensis]|uniref:YbaB/EbfC DNA-binding family protein n=1 Tax=Nocardia tenerifensis TaxID=228006 RepID=A0A318JTG1_9NOCA|nr:YbaB/EbfC family nucleoid-associated protein [Nocardia tenerifensis]PXX56565.1 YbaB/EbfC DNA-binding family protein [Nocardia tenerifensis]